MFSSREETHSSKAGGALQARLADVILGTPIEKRLIFLRSVEGVQYAAAVAYRHELVLDLVDISSFVRVFALFGASHDDTRDPADCYSRPDVSIHLLFVFISNKLIFEKHQFNNIIYKRIKDVNNPQAEPIKV